MLNEPRQRVTTYPGTGQVVTAPGASCNVHGWLLVCSSTNSATFVRLDEVKCICSWPSWKMAAILDFRLTNLTEWI